MECQDARRLIDRGVKPGTTDLERRYLGFHLSRCASCRTYRRDVEAIQVLTGLLAQPGHPPRSTAHVRRWQMALRPARVTSAMLIISGAMALLPSTGLLPTAAAAQTATAQTMAVARDVAARPDWRAVVLTAARDDAVTPQLSRTTASNRLLRELLEAPPAPSEMRGVLAQARAAQAAEVAHQQALLRELLEAPPAPSEMRGVLAQARNAAKQVPALEEAAVPPEIGTTELALGQQLNLPPVPVASVDAQWYAPNYTIASTYVVQPGDTLWAIAERFYGNGALWPAIYHANADQIGNPDLIYPNQYFDIPAQPVWTDQYIVYHPRRPEYRANWQGGNYTIVRGDTLSGIAYRVYGDASRWHEIYSWNWDVIGGDPDLIYPGTMLSLPPA